MSQRERWVVYPLLFFSFALAIRDQWPTVGNTTDFNVVTCRHLIVRDAQGQPAVNIHAKPGGATGGSGVVVIYGQRPAVGTLKKPAVRLYVTEDRSDDGGQYGVVATYGPLGSPATQLVSDGSGGTLRTFDAEGRPRHLIMPTQLRPAKADSTGGSDDSPAEDDPRSATPRPPRPDAPPSGQPTPEPTAAASQ